MEMKKCMQGHYYDASIHSECPYCTNVNDYGATLPLDMYAENTSATMPYSEGDTDGKTVSIAAAMNSANEDDGRTVALVMESSGIDPVVGWFVCIDGVEKGRDYRIHSDNNYIGRSNKMDICIRGDETISRENHAIVSYDMLDNKFYFSPGDGRAIVRYNDKALFQTIEMNAYDTITVGKTKLLFIPLCCDAYTW